MNHDNDDCDNDEIIEALSSLLEFVGILPSSSSNSGGGGDDLDNDVDPDNDNDCDSWRRLSDSLRDLMLLLAKLDKALPMQLPMQLPLPMEFPRTGEDNTGTASPTTKTTTETTTTTNASANDSLLLAIETKLHEVRENKESVSNLLARRLPIQLARCRTLESMGGVGGRPSLLLPLAKALSACVKKQKAAWKQCLAALEGSIDRLYENCQDYNDTHDNCNYNYNYNYNSANDHGADKHGGSSFVLETLRLVHKRVNRRCIEDPESSPWREATELLEDCIVSSGEPPGRNARAAATKPKPKPKTKTKTKMKTKTKTKTKTTSTATTSRTATTTAATNTPDADRYRESRIATTRTPGMGELPPPPPPPPPQPPIIPPVLRYFSHARGCDCASSQLPSIVNAFFHHHQGDCFHPLPSESQSQSQSQALAILVVGPEGSGKTHLLDAIDRQCRSSGADIEVVHPFLPIDAIGTTAGAAEDLLISMMGYAMTRRTNTTTTNTNTNTNTTTTTTTNTNTNTNTTKNTRTTTREKHQTPKHCILLLDDIDGLCGGPTTNNKGGQQQQQQQQGEPHLQARLRNLFFSLLDVLRTKDYEHHQYHFGSNSDGGSSSSVGRTILVCTSQENFGRDMDRFDRILPLKDPNREERRRMISEFYCRDPAAANDDDDSDNDNDNDNGKDACLENLVDCTLGFSRAEIAHHCRQAMSALHARRWTRTDEEADDADADADADIDKRQPHNMETQHSDADAYALAFTRPRSTSATMSINTKTKTKTTNRFARYLQEKLRYSTPESLKNGATADFVDMRVFTARDLRRLYPIRNHPRNAFSFDCNDDEDEDGLPLFGASARAAWRELWRLVVLPVCRGEALDKILYHHSGSDGNRRRTQKAFAGGVLLAASPGTGKSTLAGFCGAVAASLNPSVRLIDVSCTSLIHKEVGGSEKALHRLFRTARSATPCILVMDGIETIAAVRGNDNTTEGTMDRVLSTLLTELDGAESETSSSDSGGGGGNRGRMAVIGITHDPEWIDPSLRRPGRLEKTILLDNPDKEGRRRIFRKELGNAAYRPDDVYPLLATLDDLAERVAAETEGCTGAEVTAICNDAKLTAFHNYFRNDTSSNSGIGDGNGDGNGSISNSISISSINGKQDFITPRLVLEAAKNRRARSGR